MPHRTSREGNNDLVRTENEKIVYQRNGGNLNQHSFGEEELVPVSSYQNEDSHVHTSSHPEIVPTSSYPGPISSSCYLGSLFSSSHPEQVPSSSHPSCENICSHSGGQVHPLSQPVIKGDTCPLYSPSSQCQKINNLTQTLNGPCYPKTSPPNVGSESGKTGQYPGQTGDIEEGQCQIANQTHRIERGKWSDNTLDMVSSLDQSDNTWIRTFGAKVSPDTAPSNNPSERLIQIPSDINNFTINPRESPTQKMTPDINPLPPQSPVNLPKFHTSSGPQDITTNQQLVPTHYGPAVTSQLVQLQQIPLNTGENRGSLLQLSSDRRDLPHPETSLRRDQQPLLADTMDQRPISPERAQLQQVLSDRKDPQSVFPDIGDVQTGLPQKQGLAPGFLDQPPVFSLQSPLYLTDYSGRCQCGSPLNLDSQLQSSQNNQQHQLQSSQNKQHQLQSSQNKQQQLQSSQNQQLQLQSSQNNKQQSHTTDV